MSKVIASVVFALLAGCAGGYTATATYSTGATANLVEVSPGVYAVSDVEQPVFYSGNTYWLYSNGGWYASRYRDREWRYASPPVALRRIDPYVYVHRRHYEARTRPPYRHRD